MRSYMTSVWTSLRPLKARATQRGHSQCAAAEHTRTRCLLEISCAARKSCSQDTRISEVCEARYAQVRYAFARLATSCWAFLVFAAERAPSRAPFPPVNLYGSRYTRFTPAFSRADSISWHLDVTAAA